MTRLADDLLREALADEPVVESLSLVADNIVPYRVSRGPGAA